MKRIQLLVLTSALLVGACNDDTPSSDTDPSDTVGRDTGGTDASDVESDTATDAEADSPADTTQDLAPDIAEPDVPEPDAPGPDVEPDVLPDIDPPDAEPDLPPGTCTLGEVCDDHGICAFDAEGCGFDPVCVEVCPPTDPVNVCGCEGRVLRVLPGCAAAEFAYVLDDIDQRAELEGAECDPSEFRRLLYSAEVRFTEFDAFVGRTLHIRVPSNWDDSYVIEESHPITAGTFELAFPYSLDTDLFGWFFEWYVDLGGDDFCDSDVDPAWTLFVSNRFDAGPVTVEVSGDDELNESTCDFWDET